VTRRDVRVPTGPVVLPGELALPATAPAIVVFAHGSGSSRLSPRNRQVAAALQHAGIGTLLFDLLTEGEARDRANVFDIPLLGRRVAAAVRWLDGEGAACDLPLGLFGASTGAAAALWAAVELGDRVGAVVSRGGRPDLAGERLSLVRCPTLLVVGGADTEVLALNRAALRELGCPAELAVVPGATHLFEEPGALEHATDLACAWFGRHLAAPARPPAPPPAPPPPDPGDLPFADRADAGRRLARVLESERDPRTVVVGLPRGGVAVAAEVARALDAPLEVVAVRKVGHPRQPEFAIGAVTHGGGLYLRSGEGLSDREVATAVARASERAAELDQALRLGRPEPDLHGRVAVVVDDGLATGATMIAALRWARAKGAARVVAAFPVGAAQSMAIVRAECDRVVCPNVLPDLGAVGYWYRDFEQVETAEVLRLLAAARPAAPAGRDG
jgi:predicted phosphoribosyltransferase/dienelactone hydrolase